MECAGEDEVVIGGELLQARIEVSLVDEASRLVQDEDSVYDPTPSPDTSISDYLTQCLEARDEATHMVAMVMTVTWPGEGCRL
ncbi:hypothetical protein TWF506_002320 [Arthrobotrys conoides]|uniref:Uncharacterized protein n=1 Tax=Arthrobotrys conoides TaxID=74498 RepID=A0AAN8MZG1_9PEZI